MTNIGQSFSKNDEWDIVVDRKVYVLKGDEFNMLMEAIASGNRGIVNFGDVGFSIAHISSYSLRHREPIVGDNQLPEHTRLTDEERQRSIKKLDEMRKTVYDRLKTS